MPSLDQKYTPLHHAAKENQLEQAQELLGQGADVDARDSKGQTPLHLAALWSNEEVARLLVSRGADVKAADKWGRLIMGAAAFCGWRWLVEMILQDGSGDALDEDARGVDAALLSAARGGHVDLMELLVRHGASIKYRRGRYPDGMTVLSGAIHHSRIEAAEWLLQRGADVEDVAAGGGPGFQITMLSIAAANNHSQMVKLLLQHGADVNRNFDDRTALHWAASEGAVEAMQVLLQHGAQVEASEESQDATLIVAGSIEAVQVLIAHGADLQRRGFRGDTLLHDAVFRQNWPLIEFLLQQGVDPNTRNDEGRTPLQVAEQNSQSCNPHDVAAKHYLHLAEKLRRATST